MKKSNILAALSGMILMSFSGMAMADLNKVTTTSISERDMRQVDWCCQAYKDYNQTCADGTDEECNEAGEKLSIICQMNIDSYTWLILYFACMEPPDFSDLIDDEERGSAQKKRDAINKPRAKPL